MNHALRHQVTKRASLPLTAQDVEDLAAIRQSPDAPAALSVDGTSSEAAILHRVLELGIARARELLDEEGYAALAADPERAGYERATRARRRG